MATESADGRTVASDLDDPDAGRATGGSDFSVVDRALYALFARHADDDRHAVDRKRYRGTALKTGFDVFLARAYGLSWLAGLAVAGWTALLVGALSPGAFAAAGAALADAGLPVPSLPRRYVVASVVVVAGVGAKATTVRLGSAYLRWRASARRAAIERTLPGAARYLHALSSGSDGPRAMLARVADNEAYGETAVSIRAALNTAALTGSLREGLGRVARDTPSRDALAPFLLKFREHATQGDDALATYLGMESRMLGQRGERTRERNVDFMELVAELFVVLLVLPALLVVVLTVMSILAPGLSDPVATPLGTTTVRALAVYGSAAFVLVVGGVAALVVSGLRPADQRVSYRAPRRPVALLRTVPSNPASAAVVCTVPAAVCVAAVLWTGGLHPVNVALAGYVAYALPVGAVAVRRGRRDDAKDREISDFVHAVAGHVGLGRPLPDAVERVAEEVDLGPLNPDVADLAFNLTLAGKESEGLRTAALERFVERVGTPLAAQTMGLVTGALDAGSDAEAVFDTLQTEIGRLYHEKRALRSNMSVYVVIGWTTALLVVGIVVAVNATVLDGFAQLSQTAGAGRAALDPNAVQPARDGMRFYVVTQATVLASGWFAGAAQRGGYAMLLHSGAMSAVCFVVFAGVGVI
ncbi:type II secretion system F family protein [Candidatus Halobonum tyrrellensis]|nr:type II secretion system F family protein [Candidatus Halobonum tyrrellensis]